MTQQPVVSAELETFIRKEIGLADEVEIKPSDSLVDEFGITGDHADKFMEAYSTRFNVRPGDFDFNRYFEMEGLSFWPFSIFTNWLHRRWGVKKYEEREPLTIAMLQHAIDLGVWDSQRLSESSDPAK